MRLRNKVQQDISFLKGLDSWNKEAQSGSDYLQNPLSHPYRMQSAPEGFYDDILNLVFDPHGALIQRGPIRLPNISGSWMPNNVSRLNSQRHSLVHPSHPHMLWGVINSAALQWNFFREGDTTFWAGHTYAANASNFRAVYYNGSWWVIPILDTANILKIDDSGGSGVITQIDFTWPLGPNGYEKIIWKDRVFTWGTTGATAYIMWSKATDPGVWTVPDGGYVKIEGETGILDFTVWNDTLYILTQSGALYTFNYTDDPAIDGFLQRAIDRTGIPGSGITGSMCVSDDQLFIATSSNIYRIVNNTPIPIADQLHLDLNFHSRVAIWDISDGLLVQTHYAPLSDNIPGSANSKNRDILVYNHKQDAWTRVEFPFHDSDVDNATVTIDRVWVKPSNTSTTVWIFLTGLGVTKPAVQGGAENTHYLWHHRLSYLDDPMTDQILTLWNGTGSQGGNPTGSKHRNVKIKLQTSVIYQGLKDVYKRYWNFVLDAFLGFRQEGSSPNLQPYKTTIEFVPKVIPDKTDSLLQRTPSDVEYDTQYVIPVSQRGRGLRFTFETEDTIETATIQKVSTGASATVDTRVMINGLTLIYSEVDRKKFDSSATAYTTSGVR